MRKILDLSVIILLFTCCYSSVAESKKTVTKNPVKLFLGRQLYTSIYRYDVKSIKKFLWLGADPNFCVGDYGWADSIPIFVVTDTFYKKTIRVLTNSFIEPEPDLEILNILIEKGADVNSRPFVWYRVYNWDNKRITSSLRSRKEFNLSMEAEDIKEHILSDINDANRILRGLLEAGADPDILGHPYPFSLEAIQAKITDEEAKEYFKKGTRAINVAIEKGIMWESQVDLLLEYTTLDEESLNAAKRSEDPKMIEKINKLWNEQN